MDPELKKLLDNTYKLAEENNVLLRKIRGVQKREVFFRLMYWLFLIGVGVGAFYFVQPYVDEIKDFFKGSSAVINKLENTLSK